MSNFDPTRYAPGIAGLLESGRVMPVGRGRPDGKLRAKLTGLDADQLFAPARIGNREMAEACLAALWLYADDLDESHRISQSLHGREGSYWHGIMHRREGDHANAKYWFRRTGPHPIHEALNLSARALARDAGAEAALRAWSGTWDPAGFVDLCEAAGAGRSGAADLCRKIQEREWQLLFDYCYRRATGHG